jgi:hypothetical protein
MESVGPDATRWMTTESEQKSAHRFLEAHAEAHLQMQFVYRDGWDDYYRLKSAASPVCETEATIYDAIVAACKGEEKGLTVTHKLTPEGPIYETGRPLELSEVVQSNYLFYNFGSPLMFAACYPGTFVVDWEQGSISLVRMSGGTSTRACLTTIFLCSEIGRVGAFSRSPLLVLL